MWRWGSSARVSARIPLVGLSRLRGRRCAASADLGRGGCKGHANYLFPGNSGGCMPSVHGFPPVSERPSVNYGRYAYPTGRVLVQPWGVVGLQVVGHAAPGRRLSTPTRRVAVRRLGIRYGTGGTWGAASLVVVSTPPPPPPPSDGSWVFGAAQARPPLRPRPSATGFPG